MDVVDELHVVADPGSDLLKQLHRVPDILPCIQIHPVVSAGGSGFRGLAVGRAAVAAALAAQVGDPHLLKAQDIVTDLLDIPAVHVPVDRDALPDLSAEELVEGHIRQLALDVPQRHVHAGNSVVFNGAVAPVGVLVHQLPQLLDVLRVPPHKKRLQVLLHQMPDRQVAVGKGGAPQAIQPRLVGLDLDGHKVDPLRRSADDFDACDFYCHACSSLLNYPNLLLIIQVRRKNISPSGKTYQLSYKLAPEDEDPGPPGLMILKITNRCSYPPGTPAW